jgi:hypothetical protein
MDASFNGCLHSISVEDFGGSVAQVYRLSGASGFWNAGLALERDQSQTPEPATPGLALLGLASLLAIARKGRTYDQT